MNVWDFHALVRETLDDFGNDLVAVMQDGLDLIVTDTDGDSFVIAIDTAVDG